MKLILTMLVCCLVIAAARAAIAVLALAILLTLVWGLYARTAQTLGYLFVCAIVWFVGAHPKWTLAITLGAGAVVAIRSANHLLYKAKSPSDSP